MILFSFVAPIIAFSFAGIKSWHDGYPKEGLVFLAVALAIVFTGASYMGIQIWTTVQNVVRFFLWIFSIALSG